MRCLSCDCELSNFEATRKYLGTQKYVDLCNRCFSTIKSEIQVHERADLRAEADDSDENSVDEEFLFNEGR